MVFAGAAVVHCRPIQRCKPLCLPSQNRKHGAEVPLALAIRCDLASSRLEQAMAEVGAGRTCAATWPTARLVVVSLHLAQPHAKVMKIVDCWVHAKQLLPPSFSHFHVPMHHMCHLCSFAVDSYCPWRLPRSSRCLAWHRWQPLGHQGPLALELAAWDSDAGQQASCAFLIAAGMVSTICLGLKLCFDGQQQPCP